MIEKYHLPDNGCKVTQKFLFPHYHSCILPLILTFDIHPDLITAWQKIIILAYFID